MGAYSDGGSSLSVFMASTESTESLTCEAILEADLDQLTSFHKQQRAGWLYHLMLDFIGAVVSILLRFKCCSCAFGMGSFVSLDATFYLVIQAFCTYIDVHYTLT